MIFLGSGKFYHNDKLICEFKDGIYETQDRSKIYLLSLNHEAMPPKTITTSQFCGILSLTKCISIAYFIIFFFL